MKPNSFIYFLVACWIAIPLIGCTTENPIPEKTPYLFFPNARNFVLKNPILSSDNVSSIESKLETKLNPSDLAPTFHIATDSNKKPLGTVLFLEVDSPMGALQGGIGLNMQGTVVRVEIFDYTEVAGPVNREFLDQFIGMGIEDAFQVGEDVKPISGQKGISESVALLPRKALLMTYALYAKKTATMPESVDVAEELPDEGYEPETLIELMEMMRESYIVIREYFQSPTNQAVAVKAAKRLENYIQYIDYFEPPNNPNETEEYTYFQDQVSASLSRFVDTLDKEGDSDNSRQQWKGILDLVDKAHLRFSIDEVDLDEDLE